MMLDSIIRTTATLVVALLLGWAAKIGLNIPGEALTLVVTAVVGSAFYTAVRLLEQRWPIIGQILLGLGLARRAPRYVKPGTLLVQARVGSTREWPPPPPIG